MLNPGSEIGPQGESGFNSTQVLCDLMRQIKPLVSEEPEDILRFFVKIGEIYELGLVDDRVFITRFLPFVPGDCCRFWARACAKGAVGRGVRLNFWTGIFPTSCVKD
jgi:hypothetical protein